MADPHINASLDWLDRVTIIVYRIGLLASGLALFTLALQQFFYPLWFKHTLIFIAFGAMLQASNLHIYSKYVRWGLVSAAWLGCWLLSVSFATASLWVAYISFGGLIVTLSGLAYKESYCFSLPVLKVVPILLVISWLLIVIELHQWAAFSLVLSALLYLYMGWRKINMPLHFDMGDRSKYEV